MSRVPAAERSDEGGASVVEYALIMGLIAIVCVTAVTFFGRSTGASLARTNTAIGNTPGPNAGAIDELLGCMSTGACSSLSSQAQALMGNVQQTGGSGSTAYYGPTGGHQFQLSDMAGNVIVTSQLNLNTATGSWTVGSTAVDIHTLEIR